MEIETNEVKGKNKNQSNGKTEEASGNKDEDKLSEDELVILFS